VTPTWQIFVGDVRDTLKTVPDQSVQCCVTSPPYWGLRDYGCEGQLGLEATPELFVAAMVEVFREVKRCLRDDGTLWLNIGDSYAREGGNTKGVSRHWDGRAADPGGQHDKRPNAHLIGLKQKDLCGIPWRLAFALQADGWYLRSDIIWSKPNPMPESVTDRPTKSHEYIFLLTKNARYFYDMDAIREAQSWNGNSGTKNYRPGVAGGRIDAGMNSGGVNEAGRNCRSVWQITTQPYPDAHFATFPEALPERCIKAGTSERGACPQCGAGWVRVQEATGVSTYAKVKQESWRQMNASSTERGLVPSRPASGQTRMPNGTQPHLDATPKRTTGWAPSCECTEAEPVPQIVLDPFTGSGTTGQVAIQLGRSFIGCELSEEYATLAKTRIGGAAPLFAVEVA